MFGLRARKPSTAEAPLRLVGVDMDATRARAVVAGEGKPRPVLLDELGEDLPLFLQLDERTPVIGSAAVAEYRTSPHRICSNFLGALGIPQEWRGARHSLSPESATKLILEKLSGPLSAETDSAGLALPAYLSVAQARTLLGLVQEARLPIRGSASAPLAIAAHRSGTLNGPATVLIVDVDEFALSGAVVQIQPNDIRLLASAHWPQASLRNWKNRLIDGMADHCVQTCRRDPRDSAEAEQGMYDQLETFLEQARTGQRSIMQIRGEHWFQDLSHDPAQVERYCTNLVKIAGEGLKQLLLSASLQKPPEAVWLSHTAGRLPGLAAKLYQYSPEETAVSILPRNAAAEAVAALLPRWLQSSLPKLHLDSIIPLEKPTGVPQLPAVFIGKTPLKSALPSAGGRAQEAPCEPDTSRRRS